LTAVDLDWYTSWISRQLEALPADLKDVVTLTGRTLNTHEDVTAVFSEMEKSTMSASTKLQAAYSPTSQNQGRQTRADSWNGTVS